MATAEQIQNCKKIMHEEIGQDDVFDELFDLVMSKSPTADVLKDPEIVAFLQTKNLPPIDIDVNIKPLQSIKSFKEAFRYGLKLSDFELEKARIKKHLIASFRAVNRKLDDFLTSNGVSIEP